jgi:hypothetical protein
MSWDNTFVQDQTFETFVRNTLEKYPFGVGVFQGINIICYLVNIVSLARALHYAQLTR